MTVLRDVVLPTFEITRTLQGPLIFANTRPLLTVQFAFAITPLSETVTEARLPAAKPACRAMCLSVAPFVREIFGCVHMRPLTAVAVPVPKEFVATTLMVYGLLSPSFASTQLVAGACAVHVLVTFGDVAVTV